MFLDLRAVRLVDFCWRLGLMFHDALVFGQRVPGLIRWATRANRCLSTVVLSNVGDAAWHFRAKLPDVAGRIRAGNVVLTRFTAAPPVRPNTRAVLVVTRTGGQLTLTARCEPHRIRPRAARSLLRSFVERLLTSAAD